MSFITFALVFHIYSFHIFSSSVFSLLICSNIPPPSSEPQALADVVMSYSSSTETWSCLCSLMQTSCQSNSSDTGAITCLSFCPFLCFFLSIHSFTWFIVRDLCRSLWIHLLRFRQVRGSEVWNTEDKRLQCVLHTQSLNLWTAPARKEKRISMHTVESHESHDMSFSLYSASYTKCKMLWHNFNSRTGRWLVLCPSKEMPFVYDYLL